MDISIEELTVEELCRTLRQELCIEQLMPRVIEVLTEDPLAGEYYDDELIAALATIKSKYLKKQSYPPLKIKEIINQLPLSEISNDLKKDIEKINQLIT